MSEMEELLRIPAEVLQSRCPGPVAPYRIEYIVDALRESGLLRLLEAGQAMRDGTLDWAGLYEEEGREWDAALAAMKEQVHVTTIPSTASTSNGPSYDPWAEQPSASQEFDARAEFERWWRSEGITHLPKPGEPPQHAYVAARTWEAAYAAGFQRGQMPFIAGAAGKREGQHGQ